MKRLNETNLAIHLSKMRDVNLRCEPNIADNEYLNIDNIIIYKVIDLISK